MSVHTEQDEREWGGKKGGWMGLEMMMWFLCCPSYSDRGTPSKDLRVYIILCSEYFGCRCRIASFLCLAAPLTPTRLRTPTLRTPSCLGGQTHGKQETPFCVCCILTTGREPTTYQQTQGIHSIRRHGGYLQRICDCISLPLDQSNVSHFTFRSMVGTCHTFTLDP